MTRNVRKKHRYVLLAALICFFFAGLSFISASHTNSADSYNENELEKIRKINAKKQKRLQEELKKKKLEEKGVIRQLDKVENELYSAQRDLNTTVRNLKKTEAQSSYLEKQLSISNEKFETYRKKHEERLVAYYKNGHAGYLEVLFNSSSFSDFISRIYYLQLLTKHDLEVMTKLKALHEDVITKRELVQRTATEMESRKRVLAERKAHAAQLHNMKKSTLQEIQKDRRLLEQQYAQLEKENQEIENQLRRARGQEPTVPTFTGRFSSPVCGRSFYITSPFGPRRRPTAGASTNHKGVDLRARYGTDICAAADGVVFSATYGRGYGRYIIIRHGSSYATVYAHGLKLLVKQGDRVKKGQVIMKADSSGYSTGSHLHFEIRKNGVAQDPTPYFCGKSVRQAHRTCP